MIARFEIFLVSLSMLPACDLLGYVGSDVEGSGDEAPDKDDTDDETGDETGAPDTGSTSGVDEPGTAGGSGDDDDDDDGPGVPDPPSDVVGLCHDLPHDGPVAEVDIAVVRGQAIPDGVFMVHSPNADPCLWSNEFSSEVTVAGAEIEPGEFKTTIHEVGPDFVDGEDEYPPSAIGEPVFFGETFVVAASTEYVLVVSDDLQTQDLVPEPGIAPSGRYSVRLYNLREVPISLFAWDRLDLDVPPRVVAEDLPPGGYTERLDFPLVPVADGTGFAGAVVITENPDVHPMVEFADDPFLVPGGPPCGNDFGRYETYFIGGGRFTGRCRQTP